VNRINLNARTLALMLGFTLCSIQEAHAQTPDKAYAAMAPLTQYLMTDRDAEVQLARSAAPAAISGAAEVLVLTGHGYDVAAKGSNGFVCIVERSWTSSFDDPEFWNPKVRSAICFNPPAVRSVLPLTFRKTGMALAGLSRDQIVAAFRRAIDNKMLPPIEVGAMSYMMSQRSYLGDSSGHGPSHLMFFGPNIPDGAGWGENLPGSPIIRLPEPKDSPEPVRTYIIPMPTWSDGTPASMEAHRH
jgi:hypothetical protein